MGIAPGLDGYLAAQREGRESTATNLQNAQALMGLSGALQEQQRQQAFRTAMAGATTPEQQAQIAAQFAGPGEVMRTQQASLDRRAMLEQRAAEAQQRFETQRANQEMLHEIRLGRAQTDEQRLAETQRHNQAMERLNANNAQMNQWLRSQGIELQRLNRENADRDRRDRAVTSFANELQQNKLPGLSASITAANDLMRKYEQTDIPGLGLVSGSSKVPNMFRSEEANNVRSTLQAVSNDLLNLYSGLAVTLPEAERRELEEMRGGNFSSQDFKNSWPRVVARYNSVVGNLRAGANADVLKEYQSRPGAMRLDPVRPAFGAVRIANDDDYNKLPSGARFIGPDGEERVKP